MTGLVVEMGVERQGRDTAVRIDAPQVDELIELRLRGWSPVDEVQESPQRPQTRRIRRCGPGPKARPHGDRVARAVVRHDVLREPGGTAGVVRHVALAGEVHVDAGRAQTSVGPEAAVALERLEEHRQRAVAAGTIRPVSWSQLTRVQR